MLVSFSLHQVQRSNGRPQCFCHSGIRLSVCYLLNSHCLNTLTHLCEKTLIFLRALHAPVISWAPSRTHQKCIIRHRACTAVACMVSFLFVLVRSTIGDTDFGILLKVHAAEGISMFFLKKLILPQSQGLPRPTTAVTPPPRPQPVPKAHRKIYQISRSIFYRFLSILELYMEIQIHQKS